MGVCRALLVLLVALSCCCVRAAEPQAQPRHIRIASEVWSDYTEANGEGLGWDILREVFEPLGVTIERCSVPYTRSVGLVQRGEVDAHMGAYRDESPGVLYPRWNYDTDHIYALGLASNPELSLATIASYRLVWVRGYKYQDYLPNVRRYNEIRRRIGILPMLLYSRADYYIDAQTEIDYVLAGLRSEPVQAYPPDRAAALPGVRQQPARAGNARTVRPAHGATGEHRAFAADFRALETALSL